MNYKQTFYTRLIPIILSMILTGLAITAIQTESKLFRDFIHRLDYLTYDLRYKNNPTRHAEKDFVKIVAIDEKSLTQEGRWPWSRDKIAALLKKIQASGAAVVAFDILFTEPETNIAQEVIDKLNIQGIKNQQLDQLLNNVAPSFDYDQMLAQQLKQGTNVLGILLANETVKSVGELPAPIYILNAAEKTLAIPEMQSYAANIPILQKATQHGGFLSIFPDDDGILRRAPLLLSYQGKLYPSLALEATRLYLYGDKINLVSHLINNVPVLEGVTLGHYTIPTDQYGQVLIPYVDPKHNFTYFSATDVLNSKKPIPELQNTIVFVGATALGLTDLRATVMSSVQPGVEIHASIAAGLLQQNFPSMPPWAKGAELLTLLIIGLLLAFLLPFIGAFWQVALTLLVLGGLFGSNIWFWREENLALPVALPIVLTFILAGLNISYGFFAENYRRRQLKEMFNQYVPRAHIDAMLKSSEDFGLTGETREMTVLFADIRDFTHISENLTVTELKEMLNIFFTELTDVILKNNGTVDKYIGDLVMAFWGAPLENKNHAADGLRAAFQMQEACKKLQPVFDKRGLPPIKIGIGINTGTMNVGDMGSKFRRSYTVLGDAVNTGSRVESLTKYYHVSIIATEFTAAGEGNIIFRHLDKITVKGKDKPIIIYEPLCYRNSLKENELQALLAELEQLKQAIHYYDGQEWDKSLLLFKQLQADHPQVFLYQLYIERIDTLRQQKVENWDGVYRFKEK